jgi:hypothetical protein
VKQLKEVHTPQTEEEEVPDFIDPETPVEERERVKEKERKEKVEENNKEHQPGGAVEEDIEDEVDMHPGITVVEEEVEDQEVVVRVKEMVERVMRKKRVNRPM